MRTSRRPLHSPGEGFTIVELVVIVAVIGIVASLLIPGLAKAQSRAKGIQCLSNLRQWSFAMNVYATEHDDQMPRDGTDAEGQYGVDTGAIRGPGSPNDGYAWFNALPANVGDRPLSNYWARLTEPREDLPFPGKRGPIWHCPAARSSGNDRFLKGGAFGFFSMVMNADLKLLNRPGEEGPPRVHPYPNMPRLASIPNPAITVLFTDTAFSPTLEPYTSVPGRNGIFPAGRSTHFAQRHTSRGANIVFIDGHASFFRRSYITNTLPRSGEKATPDVTWNPNPVK